MKAFKILVPLAVAVSAAAIAVGSGATYSSTNATTIGSAATGPLTLSNSKGDAAIFEASNIKPGDVVGGSLTITSTASRPARLQLTETGSVNPFGRRLSMVITNTTAGVIVYAGTFGGLVDGVPTPLGFLAPGMANDYQFRVVLDPAAPNAHQGKTAAVSFSWHATPARSGTNN